ncbi:MAG: peptide deformylase [Polyangiaceae bacterium]
MSKPPPIVKSGHPVLRSRAADVPAEELRTDELRKLVRKMVEAMRAAPGVGLAAPQIGVDKRVIVLEDGERLMNKLSPEERAARGRVAFPLTCIVNPVLTIVKAEPATFFEGCLSVPGYMALVERAISVRVTGTNEKAEPIDWTVEGWPARILQHECDHLDGTLYVDRMLTRTFGANDEVLARWAAMDPALVREKLGPPGGP